MMMKSNEGIPLPCRKLLADESGLWLAVKLLAYDDNQEEFLLTCEGHNETLFSTNCKLGRLTVRKNRRRRRLPEKTPQKRPLEEATN
jgi:hypothetical protein